MDSHPHPKSVGQLFVVATPIGNLEDITLRAIRILKEVDLVAAEDTRHSRKLMHHYGIETPLTSYHDHNEAPKTEYLIGELEQGRNVALITDAGTPCVSDPGYRIVREAHARGINVVAVPGPSSFVAALSISGLPNDRVTFRGFFPRGNADELMQLMALVGGTHLFFESPHRLLATLARLEEALPDCEVAVAREMTKQFEECVVGTPAAVLEKFASGTVKGECVLVVWAPVKGQEDEVDAARLHELVEQAMAVEGLSRRDAIRKVAADLGVARNRVYAAGMERP